MNPGTSWRCGCIAVLVAASASSAAAQAGSSTPLGLSPSPTTSPVAAPGGVQVVARTTALIAAPMAGQLVEFPAADGEAIKDGQVVARFNCAQQEALQGRARAELTKRQDILSTHQSLKALNAYSKADFVTAQNDVAVAKAELALTQTAIDNCTVKAPFSGRVANVLVHNFQFVQAGAPMLDVVDDRDLELEFIVSSMWLAWLKIGADARVHVNETQRDYDARITRMSGKVDAASQTIKIYGRIGGDTSALLPGMSGVAQFPGAPH